ncbi:ribosomal protection-like ABC-F family protein [Enterococcus massiliensis]|uniref:ribosomal protection-like ABC-F family protein n=1 Tax=Enterococcus massiliensis TaxID=1640685 RepID=UPI00065DDD75|nr:ABC-F family ATP-binding cassette domain-containing protein [Enterococcus massiliensis]
MLIQANKVTKNFGTTPLFKKLDLTIQSGDKIGLVGINGSGKSSLLTILTGAEGIQEGVVARKKGLAIGFVPQKLTRNKETVKEYLLTSFHELQNLRQEMQRIEIQMTDVAADIERLLIQYGRLQDCYEKNGGYTLEDRISGTLKGLGIGHKAEASLLQLSGGEHVRVELARILVGNAEVLLLDEPTNHLDLEGIQWLENYLSHTKQAYLIISHDRAFLENVVNRIVEIEDEQLVSYPGNYSKYATLKRERMAALQKNFDLQQKEIQRLVLMARRYRQWANESDNDDFYRKAKEVERRAEKLKTQLIKPPVPPKQRLQQISQANRSGKEVVIAKNVGKFAGEKLLFSDSQFTLYRQERVALMGQNGSGKSTLIRCLLSDTPLDEGEIRLGANIKVGYLPQKLSFEKPELRILAYVKTKISDEQIARQTLARFGFFAEDVNKRIKDLSGGEQMRLYLLHLLQDKINFLILDEPTNHLDIYGKEELEEILAQYNETLLVVSHDRYFLKKVTEKQLLIQDNQVVKI